MKIVFTGGGTGGHFYPIIAVAQQIKEIVKERKLLEPDLYFIAPDPFDERVLFEEGITFKQSPSGKMRRYFSLKNFFDLFKTGIGVIKSIFQIYAIYPDVIFSKGGYGSIPTLFAARVFGIPVVIHESDLIPGRATLYASSFAKRIAISYEETIDQLPSLAKDKIAYTGNPVRKELATPARDGAKEFLSLEENVPVILVLGGSLGAQAINDTVLQALPDLVTKYQVIHQTGPNNIKVVQETAKVILEKNPMRHRYKPFEYLNALAMRMAAGSADLVISRAGSGAIAEVSLWQKPAILVPIPEDVSRDQRTNAFAYARVGGAIVVEQANLTPHLLVSEIDRLFANPKQRTDMTEAAKKFARPDAAKLIAEAVLDVALEHEK